MKIHPITVLLAALLLVSCEKKAPAPGNKEMVVQFANSVDEQNIFPWVVQLSAVHLNDTPLPSEGFPSGHLYPTDHLTRTAAVGFVAGALQEMGYDADTVVLGGEPVAYNVVAEQKGALYPDEVVLLGAHLDAFYGGADDNGSAVAALLEIARAVKQYSFARTIRFVAFDLEERGSIGSTRYVDKGYARDVKSAIVLDLLGYSSDEPGSQKDVFGVKVPDVGNFLFAVGNDQSADFTRQIVNLANSTPGLSKTVGILAPGDGAYFLSSAFMRSDNALLWHKGIPTVFFTDGANLRNPNYHMPEDLPETINQEFLKGNTRIVASELAIMAEVQQ